jgi:DNA-binding NarL/FixJ family response regulator
LEEPKKLRVLVVDDHLGWRNTVRLCLKNMPNVEIVGDAADGNLALETFQATDPNVILMDINMPGMDGFETAKALLDRNPSLWIIGLSADVEDDFQQRARSAGFRAVIPKDTLLDYFMLLS